jgi:hypothetical protein
MNGHSLKLHFDMFEISQGKHNSSDYHTIFGIFSINCKIYIFKAWHETNFFSCSKQSTLRLDSPFVSNIFFLTNVHHSLWKLAKDFNIDDYKGKRTWTDELFLITNLTIVLNVFLTLKMLGFENMALTKVVHIYVIKSMNR